jgi:hypothetical protein
MARAKRLQVVASGGVLVQEQRANDSVVRPIHLVDGKSERKAKCTDELPSRTIEVVAPWDHPGMCQECLIQHSLQPEGQRQGTRAVMV